MLRFQTNPPCTRNYDVTMTMIIIGIRMALDPLQWAPADIFPEGGGKPPTLKKVGAFWARRTKNLPFFGALKAQMNIFAFFRRFRLKYRACVASAVSASENSRFFVLDGSI